MGWKADSLHFVTFGSAPVAVDSLQPWQRIFGGSPQQLQNAAIGQQPFSVATGTVGNYQFTINSNPGRMELVLSPSAQLDGAPESLGDWKGALDVLLGHALLASDQISAHRLAFVANFSEQIDTPARAAELFRRNVHLDSIPSNAVDLNFGFNLPKQIIGVQCEMNRLCRWGTGVQQLLAMQIGSGNMPAISVQSRHVATLQVDINTPVIDLQDADLRKSITNQLVSEIIQVADGGYEYLVS